MSDNESIKTSLLTVIITYFILVLLLGIVISAIPDLRAKYHNHFEATHRFLGWTATALLWCQVRLQTDSLEIVNHIAKYSGRIINKRL